MTKGFAMQVERDEFQKFEDIDLMELFKVIWVEKRKVIFVTSIAAILSVVYSLSLPNVYRSEALLTTVGESSGGMSGGLSQLGGLASMAGVSLGIEGVDDVTLGLATLKSRIFLTDFITRRDILVPLMARKAPGFLGSWDDGKLEINNEVYDLEKKVWQEQKPGLQAAYSAFRSILSVETNHENGLIKVAIKSQSPALAQQWVSWLIKDLNDSIRDREVKEAKKAIAFLNKQLQAEMLLEMRAMFFRLIQKQTEIIMLSNVRTDYLFRIVDPAIIPEIKSSPNRALICILGTLSGGFLSVLMVFLMNFLSKRRDH